MLRRIRVRPRCQPAHVREVAAARPDLAAVDHPLIAVADRARLQRCQVRPRTRLRVQRAPLVDATHDVRQILRLLLVRPEQHDRRTHPVHAHRAAARHRVVGNLFLVEHLLHVASVQASVLLRPGHRQPLPVSQRLRHLLCQIRSFFLGNLFQERTVGVVGRQLLSQQRTHLIAELLFRLIEFEVHVQPPQSAHQRSRQSLSLAAHHAPRDALRTPDWPSESQARPDATIRIRWSTVAQNHRVHRLTGAGGPANAAVS